MIRNNNSRFHHLNSTFQHRSSVYHMTRPDDMEAIITEVRLISGVSKEVLAVNEDDVIIPPKRPTPSVTLRSDVLPAMRHKAVL